MSKQYQPKNKNIRGGYGRNPNQHNTNDRNQNQKYRTETIVLKDPEDKLFESYKLQKKSTLESFENDYKQSIYGKLITINNNYVDTYYKSMAAQKQTTGEEIKEE